MYPKDANVYFLPPPQFLQKNLEPLITQEKISDAVDLKKTSIVD